MDEQVDQYYERLHRRMWITKCSRFNAAKRLSNKYYWSLGSISILSVYGVSIPIFQSTIDLSNYCSEIDQFYSATATVLSVFILVLSLLEGAKNYQIRADRLYSSALKISELCRNLEYTRVAEKEELIFLEKVHSISIEYEQALVAYSENHEKRDYDLFRYQNFSDFDIKPYKAIFFVLLIFLSDYWLYFASVIILPVFFLWLYLIC